LVREEKIASSLKKLLNKKLNSTPTYNKLKELARYDKTYAYKLIRKKKISNAKTVFNKLLRKIKSSTAGKRLTTLVNKFQRSKIVTKTKRTTKTLKKTGRTITRKVRTTRRKTLTKQKAGIKKFKTQQELARAERTARKQAKKMRLASKKRGVRDFNGGNTDYARGVAYAEEAAKTAGRLKAKQAILRLKKQGFKIDAVREEKIIKASEQYFLNRLKGYPQYKELLKLVRLNKPYSLRVYKLKKIPPAKRLAKTISIKLNKFKFSNNLIKRFSKIKGKIKSVKRKVSPKRIKARVKKARVQRARIKEFKKTIRYQMDKARPKRKVTVQKILNSRNAAKARRGIDLVFDEIGRRQKLNIKSTKFKQYKNLLKKRITKAINRGDRAEILKYQRAIQRIVDDLNKKSNQPTVKGIVVTKEGGKVVKRGKSIKTIKDFQPKTSPGNYIEVKQGQQVLLQRVKTKVKNKPVVRERVFVVKSVSKKAFNFKPILEYLRDSFVKAAIYNALKFRFKKDFTRANLIKLADATAQDFADADAIAQQTGQTLNIIPAIKRAIKEKTPTRTVTKQSTKQKEKKKALPKFDIEKVKTRTLSKPIMTYGVVIKKSGKLKKLKIPPLSENAAKNVMAYNLDNRLVRTGKIVKLGKNKKIAVLPSNINTYYSINKKKFRQYKIRKKKALPIEGTYIEKNKYIADRPGEKRALSKARKKVKRVVKRKPVKKKIVKKRTRATPAQLKALKKARAVRMKKLKKKR